MLYVCRIHKILKENIYYLLKHSVHYFSFFRFRYSQYFRLLDRRARSISLTHHPLISSEYIDKKKKKNKRIFEHRPVFFDKRSRVTALVGSRETVIQIFCDPRKTDSLFFNRANDRKTRRAAQRKRNEISVRILDLRLIAPTCAGENKRERTKSRVMVREFFTFSKARQILFKQRRS